MAVQELILPHVRGFDFGVGVNRLSGTKMNQVVNPVPSPPIGASGSTQGFRVDRVYTTEDLQQKLALDVSASAGLSFGAGVSGRFSFAHESRVHSSSLFMTVSTTIKQADLSIDEPVMAKEAAAMIDRSDVFTARYGDMFCRACSRGGLFVGLLTIETFSESDATKIEAQLNGSYGMFSAKAANNFEEIRNAFNAQIYCTVYAEGGPAIHIDDPTDGRELLVQADTWLKVMHDDPDHNSVPYEWTLSPITIAEGPLPPNAVDIQHAQDVLRFCAIQRNRKLDDLNLLSWIHDHPGQYDTSVPGTAGLPEITAALQATTADLDLLADCASAAIDHPADAVMPTDFAIARGGTYPSGFVPANLPPGRSLERTDGKGTGAIKIIRPYYGPYIVVPPKKLN